MIGQKKLAESSKFAIGKLFIDFVELPLELIIRKYRREFLSNYCFKFTLSFDLGVFSIGMEVDFVFGLEKAMVLKLFCDFPSLIVIKYALPKNRDFSNSSSYVLV